MSWFAMLLAPVTFIHPYAIDGDTISVGYDKPHIRLLVIDAPEMPGHCRSGRVCVSGDPYKAKRTLQSILDSGPVTCQYTKRDYYNRWLATCSVNGRDVGQMMLASGTVGLYHYTRSK